MQFRLDGLEDALRNLNLIDEAVTDTNLRADALEALQPVVDDARSLAPVDDGDLRDSIQPIVFDDGSVGVVIRDWKGHFFEFGTVKMRATPMLMPAWDANSESLSNYFADSVRARIEAPGTKNRSRAGVRVESV